VLGVTASGPDLAAAVTNCYDSVRKIRFDGALYRTDIAGRAVKQGLTAGK